MTLMVVNLMTIISHKLIINGLKSIISWSERYKATQRVNEGNYAVRSLVTPFERDHILPLLYAVTFTSPFLFMSSAKLGTSYKPVCLVYSPSDFFSFSSLH